MPHCLCNWPTFVARRGEEESKRGGGIVRTHLAVRLWIGQRLSKQASAKDDDGALMTLSPACSLSPIISLSLFLCVSCRAAATHPDRRLRSVALATESRNNFIKFTWWHAENMTKGLGNCTQVICQLHIYTRAHRLPPAPHSLSFFLSSLSCTCMMLLLLLHDMLAIYWVEILVIGKASNHNAKHNFSCCVDQAHGCREKGLQKNEGTKSGKLNMLIKNNCNFSRLKCS